MSGEDKEEPKRKQKAERSTRTALSDDSNSAAVSPPLRVCRLVEFIRSERDAKELRRSRSASKDSQGFAPASSVLARRVPLAGAIPHAGNLES